MVCFVHNAFYLPFGQMVLVFQFAKCQPMYKPVNQDFPVPLTVDVFLNQLGNSAVRVFLHRLRLVPLELLFLRLRTVIRAIDEPPFSDVVCNAI